MGSGYPVQYRPDPAAYRDRNPYNKSTGGYGSSPSPGSQTATRTATRPAGNSPYNKSGGPFGFPVEPAPGTPGNYPRPALAPQYNLPAPGTANTIGSTALRGGLRLLPRMLPYVGFMLLLYEFYRMSRRATSGMGQKLPGSWEQCGTTCPYSVDGVDNTGCVPICAPAEAVVPQTDIDSSWTTFTEWHCNNPGAPPFLLRYRNVRSWMRTIGKVGTAERPHYAPFPYAQPFPEPYSRGRPWRSPWDWPNPDNPEPIFPPGLDPLSQPPFMPEPEPMPIPFKLIPARVPNPWRHGAEQPRRGPEVQSKPRPLPRVDPLAPPTPGQPGPTVELWPKPSEHMPTGPNRPTRPPRRVRERKIRAVLPVVIRKVLNTATEACDGVEAFWDALVTTDGKFDKAKWRERLKYHKGKKKPTCQDKARAVYDLWHLLDAPEAVKNLVVNQVEDYAFGKLGKTQAGVAADLQNAGQMPATGRGFQSGPWDTWWQKHSPRGTATPDWWPWK